MSILGRLLGGETLTQSLRRGDRNGTPRARQAFRELLVRERLLLLASAEDAEKPQVLGPEGEPDKRVLLAFINRAAFVRARFASARFLALPGREVLQAALDSQVDELIINPAGPDRAVIPQAELRDLLGAPVPDRNRILE